ncbi:hypothetical protein D3C73_16250 [compost metagenome]
MTVAFLRANRSVLVFQVVYTVKVLQDRLHELSNEVVNIISNINKSVNSRECAPRIFLNTRKSRANTRLFLWLSWGARTTECFAVLNR